MTSPAVITSIRQWNDNVKPSILEQYKESSRWLSCLKAVIDRLQDIDDAVVELPSVIDLSGDISGYHADWIAGLINIKRRTGESDSVLLARVEGAIGYDAAGTPDHVIVTAASVSGCESDDVFYSEYDDAELSVFTPLGTQLHRHDVKRMSPAGVLGYAMGAIQFADGSYMCDAAGAVMLAVADEPKSGNESPDNLKEIFE